MDKKLVSVCINVYNDEKFIKETVDSVLNQTYKNLEIIVIDNGSADKAFQTLKDIKDDRLQIYRNDKNKSTSFALNMAISLSKGEYLAHINAGDLWTSDKIEKQVEALENNSEYGVCFTQVDVIDENGKTADDSFDGIKNVFELQHCSQPKMFRRLFDNGSRICHSTELIRASVIREVGEYDTSLNLLYGYDFLLRTIEKTNLYIIPSSLTLYRVCSEKGENKSSEKCMGYVTEYARIIDKAINGCSDSLFLEAFFDRLILKGEHSHIETELEKAFLLKDGFEPLKHNPVLAINKFAGLFGDVQYIKEAEEKFGFTLNDFYELQTMQTLYNKEYEEKLLEHTKQIYSYKAEDLKDDLEYKESELANYVEELEALKKQLYIANTNYFAITNSFYWRLTVPCRKIGQLVKKVVYKNRTLTALCRIAKAFIMRGPKFTYKKIKTHFKNKTRFRIISDSLNITKKTRLFETSYNFSKNIKFSILVPLYNTPLDFLKEMINSVRNQTYGNWELCLADGSVDTFSFVGEYCKLVSSKDSRIVYKKLSENKGISENTNECLKMASGDFIALFDHDDILHPSALFEVMKCICDKNADFIYTDEVVFLGKDTSKIHTCHFKPDYSFDNLISNNYICHFSVFDAKLIEKVGGFRSKYDGSQDHELILRLTDAAKNIVHIPKILYFWRSHKNSVAMDLEAKPYVVNAGINAVHDFLKSKGYKVKVKSSAFPTIYKVGYEIIGNPKVSVIIQSGKDFATLKNCINSIKSFSTYLNYEIIVIYNDDEINEKLVRFCNFVFNNNKIKSIKYSNEYNVSAMNNLAVSSASGEYLLFLHPDTKIITPDWIQELLMFAQREDVGAVGGKTYFYDNTVEHGGIVLGLGSDNIAGYSHYGLDKSNLGYMGRMYYVQNVSAVSNICFMVKKSLFEQLGGFDESFALKYNDVDLCLRLRDIGKLNVFTPFCEMYHYESKRQNVAKNGKHSNRISAEKDLFNSKWRSVIEKGDPFYNPNFSLKDSYEIESVNYNN